MRPSRRPFTGARIETASSPPTSRISPVAPSRGRGSKLGHGRLRVLLAVVAPSRGRGSKPTPARTARAACASPLHGGADRNRAEGQPRGHPGVAPSRGRGSKHVSVPNDDRIAEVAPSRARGSKLEHARTCGERQWSPLHGGADRNWNAMRPCPPMPRRPFTGARIETTKRRACYERSVVAPSRGRGSKHVDARDRVAVGVSPLHGGADRNTFSLRSVTFWNSRPFTGARIETPRSGSPAARPTVAPSRGRGSKHHRGGAEAQGRRRPLTGARIETRPWSTRTP